MDVRKFLFHLSIRAEQFLSASHIFRRSSGKSRVIFFPGCSLTGYNPGYVFAVRNYLSEKLGDCGILTACCSKPVKLIGDSKTFQDRIESIKKELDSLGAETVITACQNCYNILRKHDTSREILSLWPVMLKNGLNEELRGKYAGLEASIQDSCSSTHEIMSSIREILEYLGVRIQEYKQLKCCGGIKLITSGNIKLGHECMRQRANESPCSTIISYCASCRSAMSIDGTHKSIHILDLIFGNGEESNTRSRLINRFITARNL